jgi:hypothetical protein
MQAVLERRASAQMSWEGYCEHVEKFLQSIRENYIRAHEKGKYPLVSYAQRSGSTASGQASPYHFKDTRTTHVRPSTYQTFISHSTKTVLTLKHQSGPLNQEKGRAQGYLTRRWWLRSYPGHDVVPS